MATQAETVDGPAEQSRAVATTDDQPKTPVKAPVAAGGKLAAFVPQTLDEAWRLAGALAASGMTPKAYGNDQSKVMVGIMAGAEIGLTPFTALQSIAVIGNNPSLWGDGALALVQASGLLDDMEETDDGKVATCRLVRKGRATAIVRTFSMDDAKQAGLAGKSGPWTQYPARMRQMRARAFALRDGFPDVLKGLHVVEEVRDYAPMAGGELSNRPALTSAMLIEQSKGAPGEATDDMMDVTAEVATNAAAPAEANAEVEDVVVDDEPSPGRIAADRIIGEVKAAAAIIDISSIESRERANIEAMDPADADTVRGVIASRKEQIKASREPAQ